MLCYHLKKILLSSMALYCYTCPASAQIAIGPDTKFNDTGLIIRNGSIGIGSDGLFADLQSISIGKSALALEESVAIGNNSTVNQSGGGWGVAIGSGAVNESGLGFAGGGKADSGQFGIALGYKSSSKNRGTALGAESLAGEFEVAVGYQSVSAPVKQGDRSIFGIAVAGSSDRPFSIGASGSERILQNVGPGVIAASSTDGVNGSQLHGVATGILKLSESNANIFGGSTSYDALTGRIKDFKLEIQGAAYGDITSAAAKIDSTMTSIANGSTGIMRRVDRPDVIAATAQGATADHIGNAQRITNVAVGIESLDAVNVSQFRDAIKTLNERIDKIQSSRR